MKTNKTIKWLLAVGLVAVIAGCDSSGSGKSGSKDAGASKLDMLDLTTVDQEALAKQVHENFIGLIDVRCLVGISMSSNKRSNKKYEEGLESGPCAYGGSINVIENLAYTLVTDGKVGHSLEVSYDHCKQNSADENFINGYFKDYRVMTIEGNFGVGRGVIIEKDDERGRDYSCTYDSSKNNTLEVITGKPYFYKYSTEAKVVDAPENGLGKISYNTEGYRSYYDNVFVHVKADAIIKKIGYSGCRTDGVVHLTGKNNSKVTIQYNADRSMDFTLNGKKEHWYSCVKKNP